MRIALHIDSGDNLYCTDDGDHTVRRCTTDGTVLLTIGGPERPSPSMSGDPFHCCTHTALSPRGEINGHGNAGVHEFTPEGKLIKSWGEAGSTDPGQFNIVYNIVADADAGFMSPTAKTTACLQEARSIDSEEATTRLSCAGVVRVFLMSL